MGIELEGAIVKDYLLVQFQAVEHAVLDVDPDKVGLCGGDELSDKGAGDAVGDAHEGFAGVGLGVFERLAEIAWVGEHGGAIWGFGVESRLLAVGLEVCHFGKLVSGVWKGGGV